MKKIIFFLSLSIFFNLSFAQSSKLYVVVLKDKAENNFSKNKPQEFLSAKAIARRAKQNISIKERDLPVTANYIERIKLAGVEIKNQSKWLNAITISCDDDLKLEEIKKLPFIKSIIYTDSKVRNEKVDAKFELESVLPASRSLFPALPTKLSTLNYGPSFFQANQIGIDCMHDLGYQGQGMTIAVIDAGFYKVDSLPAFDSLRINGQILGCRDFVIGDTLVFEDFPHGMNVLSCMGGNLPGQLVGTAPKAKFWLLRSEDAFTETLQEEMNWLVAAEFADSVGADVINSSLGYSKFDGGVGDHFYSDMNGNSTIVTNAADWAAETGIFVTTSAGNAGGPPWFKITAPADADSALTVGAVDSAGVITGFSSRGLTFDGRIKPNTCARGYQAIVAANAGGIGGANGTSFSSPITAGAVACLWQAQPLATNMQLLSAIEQSASQAMSPDSIMGYGIPDFCKADSILRFILSVSDLNSNQNVLTVYPNPFQSGFTIEYFSNKKEIITIELFDITGSKVYAEKQELTANVKHNITLGCLPVLAKGSYTLRVSSYDKISYAKLIKQ